MSETTPKRQWKSEDKARTLASWLDDKQATGIVAMNVASVCPITEYIVVATARGARHAQALADALLESAGEAGMEYLGMEGYRSADWLLMDLNDVVVHIFQEELRSLYNIEGLWREGEVLELCAAIPRAAGSMAGNAAEADTEQAEGEGGE
ncbi:MAG: ribosome silencing factor [Desulfovibrionaceae bacterium]